MTSLYLTPVKLPGMVENGLVMLSRCVSPKQSSAVALTITMMSAGSLQFSLLGCVMQRYLEV